MTDPKEFLIEDYKLKTDYLNKHFSRMLTRFNFFLTIHSAMFVLSFGDAAQHPVIVSQLGAALAVLWLCFAAADNRAADLYRAHVASAFEIIRQSFDAKDTKAWMSHVGDTDQTLFYPTGRNTPAEVKSELLSWKIPGLGVTTIPVAVALFFAGAWAYRWWYAIGSQAPAA